MEIILYLLLIFSRFFNLSTTSRFIWDESSDLVRMFELSKHFRITLVGPISENGVKVFSSLPYYMTLPFVKIFNFIPVSPAYATAFFGILTIVILNIYLKKIKIIKPQKILFFILLLISFPLLESSRWAWNPHFIPFWQSLSLLFIPFNYLISGLLLGLTIHHHWYASFACFGFLFYLLSKKTKFYQIISFCFGLFLSILPFIIFDLTRPPGLFITRALYFSPISENKGAFNWSVLPVFFTYITGQNLYFGWLLLISTILIIIKFRKTVNIKFIYPLLFLLIGLSFIGDGVYPHYLLAGVIYYYLFLLNNLSKNKIFYYLLYFLIFTNILAIPKTILLNDWTTNIKAVTEITNIIEKEYANTKKPFNIAVLSSPDPNTFGRRFRDLLKIKNIEVISSAKYNETDKVFFVSYGTWEILKNNPAYEINNFRKLSPQQSWTIKNSNWKLYLLER
jgi:hypothetical protein